MKLLFGLGNPGSTYRFNRHNFGTLVCEKAAEHWKMDFDTLECRALTGRAEHFAEEIILAKPMTFMNQSGKSAILLMEKHKIGLEDFIAIYDDIDLHLGMIRIRKRGGAGFHKGVISLIENLGSDSFARLRLGILGTQDYNDLSEFVLSDFDEEESDIVHSTLDKAVCALEAILMHGMSEAMRLYNKKQPEDRKII